VTSGNRHELSRLAAWSAERGAVSFNVYFLVATGRGEHMHGLAPEENEQVLAELLALEQQYRGRMLVRSKCQPQIMRHAFERDPDSPLLNYETRCPCGVQYCRITPEGKVTPCPYLPAVAGDLRLQSFAEVWERSELFGSIRHGQLGGKCGRCEYRELCGGCRARAFAEAGDALAEDASCAYEPSGSREVVHPARSVRYGAATPPSLHWDPAARARLDRIPSFVRGVVIERIERYALERGLQEITAELMSDIRKQMPVDFSSKLPFFARSDDA
jgi:radical SAM protein with 4Fe4S-binding SPASM domain